MDDIGKNMEIDALVIHLKSFIKKHGISDDLPSRWHKLQLEVVELADAINSGDKSEIIKEACDVAIVAIHIMLIAGAVNPCWNMFLKLKEVAAREKYKQIAAKIKKEEEDGKE